MPERGQHIGYNSLKPVVRYAREHWSQPGHTPFRGFEDSAPGNERKILHNCRRQVFNFGIFEMQRGTQPEDAVGKIKDIMKHS